MNTRNRAYWSQCYERARIACEQNDLQTVESALKEGINSAFSEGAPESDRAQMQFSLGWCYHAQGRLDEAYREYKEALSIFERTSGDRSQKAADVLHNFASLLIDMGRDAEAQPFLIKALEIKRANRGENHPEVLELKGLLSSSQSNLANRHETAAPEAVSPSSTHKRRLPRGIVPTQENLSRPEEGMKKPVQASQQDSSSASSPILDSYVFFPVSVPKMAIMSVVTFGWYLIGWQYMNWLCADKQLGKKSSQEATMLKVFLFGGILIFPLLIQMGKIGDRIGFRGAFPPLIPLAILSLLWAIVPIFLPKPFQLLSIGHFIPMLAVQSYANSVNRSANPNYPANDKLTVLNWVAIVIGGSWQLLAIANAFLPAGK